MSKIIDFIKKHPDVQAFLKRHPKAVNFLNARTSKQSFFGIHLTLLAVSSAYCLWFLFETIRDYFTSDPLILADVRMNLLYTLRTDFGVKFFSTITYFGEPVVGVLAILVFSVLLVFNKKRYSGIATFFIFFSGEAFAYILKKLIQRPRPDLLMQALPETSYSLPSGHATTVAFLFGFIGYLLVKQYRSKTMRFLIALAVLAGVSIIDYSRLYLGVHYLSDVLAGNAIGFFALFVTIGFSEWFIYSKLEERQSLSVSKIMLGLVILSLSALALGAQETGTLKHIKDLSLTTVQKYSD